MKIEKTKNARRGIVTGMGLKAVQMVLPFLMRTAMIHYMGIEYLGLNSLFTSVLHVLNLAELGVGTAMVFSMYKPIANDDGPTICALMNLYRRYYRIIGIAVGLLGLLILPMIPSLISGDVPAELNVYVLYLLNLGATVLSYWLFAYRNCLLQAHQRNDYISLITIATTFVQYGLQFFVLFVFRDYYLYVIVILATQVLNNVITALVTIRVYPQYRPQGVLPKEDIRGLNQKVRDIFTGKLGAVVLNSVDTIVISAFLGLEILAIYQNYYFILTSVLSAFEIVLSTMTAGLGNSFCTESREKNYADLEKFTFLLLCCCGVGSCCFLGLYQPFMEIWVGSELMLDMGAVVCFAVYFFIYVLNRLVNVYKDAAGLWHEDRFRPLITAGVNLGLNLLLVQFWGVYGVLLSTVASMVLVGIPWVLHNLFTLFFTRDRLKQYVTLVLRWILCTVCAGVLVCVLCAAVRFESWLKLILCGGISVLIPVALFYMLHRNHRLFRVSMEYLDRLTAHKLKLRRWMIPEK